MGKPDSVHYGVVGTGMMGVEHIRNLAAIPAATVAAIADPHGPSQDQARAEVQKGWQSQIDLKVFPDHKSLLASSHCDALLISSPNFTHAQILLDILSHPKPPHILVEKPLCTTVEDCKKVIEAAQARPGVVLHVGLEYRYMPPVARLIKEVKQGAVGRVWMVSIREHRFPFLVKVGNWNRFNRNTGGTLVEKCCHFFDLMTLIIGSKPTRVLASGGQSINHLDEQYDGETPDILDNAYVIVEYENGARGLLDLCMFAEASRNEQEISVVGDKGKIEALVPENIVRIGRRTGGRDGVATMPCHDDRIRYEGLHHGSSYLEHLDFLREIREAGKVPPTVSLEDGLLSVAIGVAAHKSIDEQRPVLLKEVL